MCKLFAQNYESYIRRFFSAEITPYTVIDSGIPGSSMLVVLRHSALRFIANDIKLDIFL